MISEANLREIIENYNAHDGGPVPINPRLAGGICHILVTRPPETRRGVKILKPPPAPPLPALPVLPDNIPVFVPNAPAPPPPPYPDLSVLADLHTLSALPLPASPVAPAPVIPVNPRAEDNTAYVFMDSNHQRWVLIKGNTKISEGAESQPDEIGFGSVKLIKIFGGILLKFDESWDVTFKQTIITLSSVTEEARNQINGGYVLTKSGLLERMILDNPHHFLFVFNGIQFEDPVSHEMRLILYAPKAGRDFSGVRKDWVHTNHAPSLQHRAQAAVSYLQGIKDILQNKSLWPVDLKPANTGYEETASGEPKLTPYDYLASGSTYTIFKYPQYLEMAPSLTALWSRSPILPDLFFAFVKQLIFEIAHMMFLIFNPYVVCVNEAIYSRNFNPDRINIRMIRGGVVPCPREAYLFNFFLSYCQNADYKLRIPPFPAFSGFLHKLRTEMANLLLGRGVIPSPLCDDEWIDEFHDLVHNFRSSPAPRLNKLENLVMTV